MSSNSTLLDADDLDLLVNALDGDGADPRAVLIAAAHLGAANSRKDPTPGAAGAMDAALRRFRAKERTATLANDAAFRTEHNLPGRTRHV